MRNSSVKLFNFGPVVREEMSFKDVSFLQIWRPIRLTEQIHLCNFCGESVEDINRNISA